VLASLVACAGPPRGLYAAQHRYLPRSCFPPDLAHGPLPPLRVHVRVSTAFSGHVAGDAEQAARAALGPGLALFTAQTNVAAAIVGVSPWVGGAGELRALAAELGAEATPIGADLVVGVAAPFAVELTDLHAAAVADVFGGVVVVRPIVGADDAALRPRLAPLMDPAAVEQLLADRRRHQGAVLVAHALAHAHGALDLASSPSDLMQPTYGAERCTFEPESLALLRLARAARADAGAATWAALAARVASSTAAWSPRDRAWLGARITALGGGAPAIALDADLPSRGAEPSGAAAAEVRGRPRGAETADERRDRRRQAFEALAARRGGRLDTRSLDALVAFDAALSGAGTEPPLERWPRVEAALADTATLAVWRCALAGRVEVPPDACAAARRAAPDDPGVAWRWLARTEREGDVERLAAAWFDALPTFVAAPRRVPWDEVARIGLAVRALDAVDRHVWPRLGEGSRARHEAERQARRRAVEALARARGDVAAALIEAERARPTSGPDAAPTPAEIEAARVVRAAEGRGR
jgi:hypothetical protein